MMNTIKTQKTYMGQSANQILDNAEISVMQAGNVEITHPCFYDPMLQDHDGDLIINDNSSEPLCLLCGPRARTKLDKLVKKRDELQERLNRNN